MARHRRGKWRRLPCNAASPGVARLIGHLPSYLRALLQDLTRDGLGERLSNPKFALERLRNPAPILQVGYSGVVPSKKPNSLDLAQRRKRRGKAALISPGPR